MLYFIERIYINIVKCLVGLKTSHYLKDDIVGNHEHFQQLFKI